MKRNDAKLQTSGLHRPTKGASDDPVAGTPPARIPGGEYDAVCYAVETGVSFGGQKKVFLKFRIHEGKYDGTELFMAINHYPNAELRPRHKYYQQWALAKGRMPHKGERLALNVFPKRLYRVLVRDTQRKHSHGKVMADCVQYSVVDSILEPLTGGGGDA